MEMLAKERMKIHVGHKFSVNGFEMDIQHQKWFQYHAHANLSSFLLWETYI